MFSALPDACCKIRPRHFIGDSVPVEDQLERRLVGNGRNYMWEIVPLRCGSLLRALVCLRRRALDGKIWNFGRRKERKCSVLTNSVASVASSLSFTSENDTIPFSLFFHGQP
jgi:hypothetical protein